MGGLKVRENWLVLVNLFYKESKSNEKKLCFPFVCVGGGGGEKGGGLSKCIFLKGSKSKIKKKTLFLGWGGVDGGGGPRISVFFLQRI